MADSVNFWDWFWLGLSVSLLIRYFLSPSDSKLRKRRWTAWIIGAAVVSSGLALLLKMNPVPLPAPPADLSEYRYLPNSEIQELMKNKGQLGISDQIVKVRHGPRILALGGYRHTQPTEGSLQLISSGPNEEIISVWLYADSADLAAAESRLRRETQRLKPPGTLGPAQNGVLNGCESRTLPASFIANNGKSYEGYAVLVTNGQFTYCLALGGHSMLRSTWDPDFQRVIRSFEAGIKDD